MAIHSHTAFASLAPEFTVVGKLHGSLLGPEFKILAGGKYFVAGEISLALLKRGTPIEELDLLEVGEDWQGAD